MKRLLPLLFASSALAATNEYDMTKGIDFTSVTNVTASQLNQLVDNARVPVGKGMIIYTNASPDTTNNTRYTNWLWIDSSTAVPSVKLFYSNAWYALSITNVIPADGSVTTAKLANGSVTEDKIAAGNVTTAKIASGNVTTDLIAAGNVTRVKIADGAIDGTKLTNNAINNSSFFTAGVVDANALGTNVVTGTSISNYSIGPNKLATNAISAYAITNATITGDKIASGAVSNSHLAAAAVTTNVLHTNVYHLLPKVWGLITGTTVVKQFGFYTLSVTSGGTGYYRVNFSPSFPSTNYAVFAMATSGGASQSSMPSIQSNLTSSVTIYIEDAGGSPLAADLLSIQIYDNQ